MGFPVCLRRGRIPIIFCGCVKLVVGRDSTGRGFLLGIVAGVHLGLLAVFRLDFLKPFHLVCPAFTRGRRRGQAEGILLLQFWPILLLGGFDFSGFGFDGEVEFLWVRFYIW